MLFKIGIVLLIAWLLGVLWYGALEPTFKFLFALPFIVAGVGLLSHWVRTRLANRLGDVENR